MKIEGHTFIITGGASGLGEGTAREIVKLGGNVIIFDRDNDRGQKIQSELGKSALFVNVDVTSEESIKTGLTKGLEQYGQLHGVINCAGIGGAMKVISKGRAHSQKFFETVLAINLTGSFNVIRLAAECIVKQNPVNEDGERAVFINTASVAAYDGQQGQAAYSASKATLDGENVSMKYMS